CVDGTCPSPTTQTCITIGPGQQICCENSQIINPTTTSTCRDLVNPRTGISDCPNVAYLCNNAAYYALMTQQCPRTCNRCPGTATVAPTTTAGELLIPKKDGQPN
ncbi:shTK domain protein, partial [Ostertagia ostertagi]